MAEEKTQNNIANKNQPDQRERRFGSSRGGFQKNKRPFKRGGRPERVKSEFDHRVLSARRVSRVTKGGKRFNLSLAIAVGNKKGKIGVGTGKGLDTALALNKALNSAKRGALNVKVTKTMSIPHIVSAKFSSAEVVLMPAPNRGLIAGSAVRTVLELGGFKDINAKILSGSKNKLNIARATLKALSMLKAPKNIIKEDKKQADAKK